MDGIQGRVETADEIGGCGGVGRFEVGGGRSGEGAGRGGERWGTGRRCGGLDGRHDGGCHGCGIWPVGMVWYHTTPYPLHTIHSQERTSQSISSCVR
jgi:hypothetical protein